LAVTSHNAKIFLLIYIIQYDGNNFYNSWKRHRRFTGQVMAVTAGGSDLIAGGFFSTAEEFLSAVLQIMDFASEH
jgi:hypothetical protein